MSTMCNSASIRLRSHLVALVIGIGAWSSWALAQTTFGTGTQVVIPTAANISVYHTQVFVRNPNPGPITVNVRYYQSIDGTPPAGLRSCTPLALLANQSSSFDLGIACGLTGSNDDFGMIILEDAAGTNPFSAYSRTQTPSGIGFSVEGFPISNFTGASADVLGLKKTAAAPSYRSNCFIAALAQSVNWQLQLVQGGTETVLATTAGSLRPYQTTRILDVFATLGLAGDLANVRATFTTGDNPAPPFIRFCTLETSANGSADFRIAKSNIGSVADAFVQNGNAFGATARLGTTENQPLELFVNNQRVMRYEPIATSPNVMGGHPNNSVAASSGQTIAGGGGAGSNCFDPPSGTSSRSCGNQTAGAHATVGGGLSNHANVDYATVAGGDENTASGDSATVGGGIDNTASGTFATVSGGAGNVASAESVTIGGGAQNIATVGYATVGGGVNNTASGTYATVAGGHDNVAAGHSSSVVGGGNTATGYASFAAGHNVIADQDGCALFGLWSTFGSFTCQGVSNLFRVGANHGFDVSYYSQNGNGGSRFVYIGDFYPGDTIHAWNGAHLTDAGVWVNGSSSKERKTDFAPIDGRQFLQLTVQLPITTWRYKEGEGDIRHVGPMAEDFWRLFGVGYGPHTIADLDSRGVALAAIQGLYAELKEHDATIAEQQREIAELRERVSQVESLRGEIAALRNAIVAATRGATVTAQVNATAP